MAGRVLDGGRLYVDVVEVNPPLVVWINLPVVAVARLIGWSEIAVYRGLLWSAALLALVLSHRALRRLGPALPSGRRQALLVAIGVVLVGIPGGYFGQREHLALILMLPWLVLAGTRLDGAGAPRGEAILLGALAAVGVGLKPQFVIVPLLVAGYGFAVTPRGRRGLQPDILAMAGVLGVYAAAALLVAPEYLALVRRLGTVYWDYVRRPLGTILAGDLRPLSVLWALGYWVVARRLTDQVRLADVLGLATLGFMAAVVLQHKGFGYHYYPAIGSGLLLVFLGLLGGSRHGLTTPFRMVAQGAGMLVLLPVLVLFLGWTARRAAGESRLGPVAQGSREIAAFLDARGTAGPVAIWSPWMDDSFPLVLERRVVWASRYPFVWFLPAFYRRQLAESGPVRCHHEGEMGPGERALLGTVAEDLRRWRPELVFVRKPDQADLLRIPVLSCLGELPMFRREFGAYRPIVDLGHFRVYQRSDS